MDEAPPVVAREGRHEPSLAPDAGFLIERHRPRPFREAYHHHASIEVNFLDAVSMTYAFPDAAVTLPEHRLVLFWAITPHRVAEVAGKGTITNIYLPLRHVLRHGDCGALRDALFAGAVVAARTAGGDGAWLARLLAERDNSGAGWRRLHLAEIEARLMRLSLEGWEVLHAPPDEAKGGAPTTRALVQVERMLRFVSERFAADITVADVTARTDLSPSHAAAVFRDLTRRSIGQHIERTRLAHAWVLLAETDLKVSAVAMDAGYRSLSSFYDAVRRAYGMAPGEVRRAARARRV